MKTNLLHAPMLVLSLGCCLCVGDDGSARRYAQFTDFGDWCPAFYLLERKDLQEELEMTPEQLAKVEQIRRAPTPDTPHVPELIANYKKRQSDPAFSASEHQEMKESFESVLGICFVAYQRKALSVTLSTNQRQRLGELVIQMRGPIALVNDAALSSQLGLSDKQTTEMKGTVKYYEADLKRLQGRYGRQHISGRSREDETRKDRQKELEALFTVIRAIEKERDADLLLDLTPEQLESWATIQGAPFSIAWPRTSLLDFPLGEQDSQNPGTPESDRKVK